MLDGAWKMALGLLLLLLQSSCVLQINLSSDTTRVKQEILKRIPVGSSVESAQEIMQKGNDFNCQMKLNNSFFETDGSKTSATYEGIDYLYCDKQGIPFICVPRWQVAVVQHNAVVKDVLVSYGIMCL